MKRMSKRLWIFAGNKTDIMFAKDETNGHRFSPPVSESFLKKQPVQKIMQKTIKTRIQ